MQKSFFTAVLKKKYPHILKDVFWLNFRELRERGPDGGLPEAGVGRHREACQAVPPPDGRRAETARLIQPRLCRRRHAPLQARIS